jgi:hypothetical protein
MSVLFRFQPVGMTRQQYDQVNARLEQSGAWPPAGLKLHVMFGSEGDLRVSEIWESEEQQRTFADHHLLAALREAGVELQGAPDTHPVHNFELP